MTDQSIPLLKVSDIDQEYEELWGNWQSYLHSSLDGLVWNLDQTIDDGSLNSHQALKSKQVVSAKVCAVPNAIASDCRYREDLIWIKQGEVANAEQWKQYLEEQQRNEEKLRKQAAKK